MNNFEKPGFFYLGREVNPPKKEILYDSKHLTTHAVCVGMTGSGKTGLGIALLEEAALDKIPALIIDPKGDLADLLLTFPHLSPEEFEPWIDENEAENQGLSPEEYAKKVAKTWKEGLAEWGEDAARIQKFRNSVDLEIYTPASQAGIPISILRSFSAPSKEQKLDATDVRDRALTITSSLLGLLGIDADPIKSREHILISSIIQEAWKQGKDLDVPTLIQEVQRPPFAKIGALDLDTFYPPKERMNLAITLNNLLASPSFHAWMEGVPLDVQQLLTGKNGKPKLSVISIAHLSDAERMFFVTLLLNEVISWMRRQSGTSSLRAILYMDEIFGFFPPVATPPSKLPMLMLLKQARAFGLGIVLATQNPVDLDYKGLANCGTWFIGKLQTDRDKMRVIEGLKTASNGEVDSPNLAKLLDSTGKRMFILRSIYEKEPVLFQTRWTLSYLRGPLTLPQIALLMGTTAKEDEAVETKAMNSKPNVPLGISEYYINDRTGDYAPHLLGMGKIHFVDTKNKVDLWDDASFTASSNGDGDLIWKEDRDLKIQKTPLAHCTFEDAPPAFLQEKKYPAFAKELTAWIYQNQTLTLYQTVNLTSNPGESEADFRVRASQELKNKLDEHVQQIQEKYAGKMDVLKGKIQRAQGRLSQKQEKAWTQKLQTFITFLTTVIGAIFGRKMSQTTINQAGSTLRRASQVGRDSQDAAQAEENVKSYEEQLKDLESQMNREIAELGTPANLEITTLQIRPRKSDISIDKIALLWKPN